MNSKQRMLIFFGILFLVFSIFIVDQFSNIPKNDPLNQTNFVVVNDHIIIIELAVTEEERQNFLGNFLGISYESFLENFLGKDHRKIS